MKISTSKPRLILVGVVLLVFVAVVFVGWPIVERSLQQARMAEAMRSVRSMKFALDGFATDFDGRYPSEATGELVVAGGTGSDWSNDYFRQLFLAGETQSESIFWVGKSPVAKRNSPDDRVAKNGMPQPSMILQAGDCHWAYLSGLTTSSPIESPLVIDPFLPGTDHFDPKLWNRKAIAVRVDGSVLAFPLDSAGHALDQEYRALLKSALQTHNGDGTAAPPVLAQPEPAP